MLGACGTGVVRQDAHTIADRQIGQLAARSRPHHDDPVLLVGVDDDQVGIGHAGGVTHQPIGLVDRLPAGTAVLRQRHPAGVDQDPSLVALVADHRRQHRQRDVVDLADTDPGHHEIEEHEHAGPDFGDAAEVGGVVRGRCGADADHRAGQPRLAQEGGGIDHAAALDLGTSTQGLGPTGRITGAGVRDHAAQFGAVLECVADVQQQLPVRRQHPGAVTVAVDLDQRRDARAGLARGLGHGLRLHHGVQHHAHVGAPGAQRQHLRQFRWRYADGVDDVAHAGRRELLGFEKRRNGRRTRRRRHDAPRDVHGLGRLEVGAQRDAQAVQPGFEACDVALHPLSVEDEARRRQFRERRCDLFGLRLLHGDGLAQCRAPSCACRCGAMLAPRRRRTAR